MPIPPLLTYNGFGLAAARQVHELTGGTTPTQIGSDITVAPALQNWPLSNDSRYMFSGFAKTFKNQRYCVALRTDFRVSIRRENEGGAGVWGEVGVTTSASNNDCTGLHVVKDGSDIYLVTVIANAGAQLEIGVSSTGLSGSWTFTTVSFLPSAVNVSSSVVVFRNRLYFATNLARVYEVDPIAGTVAELVAPWGLSFNGAVDFCVAFDRLYAVAATTYGANGRWALYEFSGGSFAFVENISSINSVQTANAGQSKPCIWTDNTNLYVMGVSLNDDTGSSATFYGSTCWRGVPAGGGSYTWTQDDDVIPVGIRVGTNRGTNGQSDRWSIIVDNDTDAANPAFYLVVAEGASPGSGHTVYRWEGFGFELGSGANTGETGPGASVSTTFALPELKQGGAEAISQPVASYPEIEADTPVSGAFRLSYRVWGTESGLTGRVYFSTEQGPPDTLATLVGGGTTFGPVTGDNGVTLFTVDIDLGASGITFPDNSTWMIDLS